MGVISLRLPDSIHRHIKDIARADGVSINLFITSAVAEKISAMETESYLAQRAKRASLAKFEAALAKVPDREPLEHDRL